MKTRRYLYRRTVRLLPRVDVALIAELRDLFIGVHWNWQEYKAGRFYSVYVGVPMIVLRVRWWRTKR